MRTLFVTVDPSYPPVSGADLRNWQNAQAALRCGPVMLASLLPARAQRPSNGLIVTDLDAPGNQHDVWTSDAMIRIPDGTDRRLIELAASFGADTLVLEATALTQLARAARRAVRHVVIDMHNVDSHLVAQAAPGSFWRRPGAAWGVRRRVGRLKRLERAAAAIADRIWVCSEQERRRLLRVAPQARRIDIVPNGIPRPELLPDDVPVRSVPASDGPRLLFVGHLGYRPNIEAARRLVDLASMLRQTRPNATLVIAGRNPAAEILALSRPGFIDIRSDPDDVGALLHDADLAVVPLESGGGTRIKVLEAMAWGVPVVATARAVDGLGLAVGEHYQAAETPEEFIAAIDRLLSQPPRYASQSAAARQFALTAYGPHAVGRAVAAALAPA